jgi:hypothetical protein
LFLWTGYSKKQLRYYDLETIQTKMYPGFEIEILPSIKGPYRKLFGVIFDKGQYISGTYTSSDKKTIIPINFDYDMNRVTQIVFVENKNGEISYAVLKSVF